MTVLVVIGILSVMMLGAFEKIRANIERSACMANLRNLHVAASGYLQQNGRWPQVNPALMQANRTAFEEAWIKALEPFGATRKTWICRTLSRSLGEPDWKTPETSRLDYSAMPFDPKPFTPFRWARQPWFVEKGDVHGEGNLLIFPDGHVESLKQMVRKR